MATVAERARAVYDSLSRSERFGLRFGLFPARLGPDTNGDLELTCALISIAEKEAA